VPYLSAVGGLMWLATQTRPDIAYACGVLSRFSSNPNPSHWTAVKHLFRYLKGTLDYKLTYSPDSSHSEPFLTYSDADHGGCKDTGRSTGAYVVMFGTGALCWRSKLQAIVARSTTEAEYVSANDSGSEILWLRNILSELGYQFNGPSTLFIDNQSAIAVGRNPEHHGRMKHMDLRFYWLRDVVEAERIKLEYIPTSQMIADALTKPLSRVRVQECNRMMGLGA